MSIDTAMNSADSCDAALVCATLNGDHAAFGSIVSRYQRLVASLAYSATGSFSQSEDLAQETFLKAWKDLRNLKEPTKLRSWLCAIARHTIADFARNNHHQPSHFADSLDWAGEIPAGEPELPEHVIRREEEAILWRTLERIPELYREPLILFYREGRSVDEVAAQLDLSVDAVKQRLARGRKYLTTEVTSFVENTLSGSGPTKAFTLSVLASLPSLALSTPAATVGSVTAKAASKVAGVSALFNIFLSVLPIASLGALLGFKMGRDAAESPRQRETVGRFWRSLVISLLTLVFAPLLLTILALATANTFLDEPSVRYFRGTLLPAVTAWIGFFYAAVATAMILWLYRRRAHGPLPDSPGKLRFSGRAYVLWILITMVGVAFILGLFIFVTFHGRQDEKRFPVSASQFGELVLQRPHAQYYLLEYKNGARQLWLDYVEDGIRHIFFAPAEEPALAALSQNGITCRTRIQGRDFEVFGWPGKILPLLCIFILSAGTVLLLQRAHRSRRPLVERKFSMQTSTPSLSLPGPNSGAASCSRSARP